MLPPVWPKLSMLAINLFEGLLSILVEFAIQRSKETEYHASSYRGFRSESDAVDRRFIIALLPRCFHAFPLTVNLQDNHGAKTET